MDSKQTAYFEQFMHQESFRVRAGVEMLINEMFEHEMSAVKARIVSLIDMIKLGQQQLGESKSLAGNSINIGYFKPTEREITFIEEFFNLHVKNVVEFYDGENTINMPKTYRLSFSSVDEMKAMIQSLSQRLLFLRSLYVE